MMLTGKTSTTTSLNHREMQCMEQAVIEAREQERSRMAMELHDNISQMVTVSKLLTDIAIIDEARREELLSASAKNLQQVIQEIKKLSASIVTIRENFILVAAIKQLFEQLALTESIEFYVSLDDEIEEVFITEEKIQIYRIIQEAIANTLKHAKAKALWLSLKNNKGVPTLSIKDNGVGFNINEVCPGMGIFNIKDRVKKLNGEWQLESKKGEGTVMNMRFCM